VYLDPIIINRYLLKENIFLQTCSLIGVTTLRFLAPNIGYFLIERIKCNVFLLTSHRNNQSLFLPALKRLTLQILQVNKLLFSRHFLLITKQPSS
jgi:hypothetical protein